MPLAPAGAQPLPVIDVPFISQSEALCGGAAAAMVLRFWGASGLTAESFASLVDSSAGGIRSTALSADIERRGFSVVAGGADAVRLRQWLAAGRPVIALIEDRPGTYHYVVVVAWHDRGVIIHDPARAPFQVMPVSEFERRWAKADRWSLLVLGRDAREDLETPADATRVSAPDRCAQLVQGGIERAQANDLAGAERELTQALGCPGGAAARELAGLRLLQRRWAEVETLASAAVDADASDHYAWKLLGTARFVGNQPAAALDAWNRAGEPTVDLVRVDGLVRTRQKVVERLAGIQIGEVLTAPRFRRAQRQIAELPSAAVASVSYVPSAGGLVQLRTAVVEGSMLPGGRAAIATAALTAASKREIEAPITSPTGGGERITLSWRFWPHRPRYAVDVRAPAPWGGVWNVASAYEHQGFNAPVLTPARRETAEVGWSAWVTDGLRAGIAGGLDRWRDREVFESIGGVLTATAKDDRIRLQTDGRTWFGSTPFSAWHATVTARTSAERRGFVAQTRAAIAGVTAEAPPDIWVAGDTGHARSILLRAHPLVDDGELRVERLGRAIAAGSAEAQWWRRIGPVGVAPAVFVDTGRTASRISGPAVTDVDAGAGIRVAPSLLAGVIRVDIAKGLRDGATALSIVFER